MSNAGKPRDDRYDWEKARGLIDAFGQSKTLNEWSQDPRCTVKREAIRTRLALGWAAEDAITRTKHHQPTLEFTHNGRTLTLRGWADQSGIKYHTLYRRIYKDGLDFADALEKGPNGKDFVMEVAAFGETKPIYKWAVDARANCTSHTLRKRIRAGWHPEEAITNEPEWRVNLHNGDPIAAFGRRMTLADWGRHTHIPSETIYQRMKNHHLNLEEALGSLGYLPHGAAADTTQQDLVQVGADEVQAGDFILGVTQDPDSGVHIFTVRRG